MFIKEVAGTTCMIRTASLGAGLDYINLLFAEAQKDFPDLQPSNVEIRHYREFGSFGLEFNISGGEIPSTYKPSHIHSTF